MANSNPANRDSGTSTRKDSGPGSTSSGAAGTDKSAKNSNNSGVEGEGSYSGARQYNEATRRFVEQGKVEEAAADAAPQTPAEARDMQAAEQAGKRKAKGEDPALRSGPHGASEDEDVE